MIDPELGRLAVTPSPPPPENQVIYHDKFFAILFHVQFLAFMLLATYCILQGQMSLKDEAVRTFSNLLYDVLAWKTGIIFGVSFVLTICTHFLILCTPGLTMHLASITAFLFATLFSLLSGIYFHPFVGIIYGLMTLIIPTVYLRNLDNIRITQPLLKFVGFTVHKHAGLIILLLLAIFLAQFYASIVTLSIWGVISIIPVSMAAFIGWLFFLQAISVFWTAQVMLNMLRTIVSGVYNAAYYLFEEKSPRATTISMVKIVFGRAFGSVCWGSMLVWWIDTFRSIFVKIQQFSPVKNKGVDQLVAFLNRWARNFNYLAFARVASKAIPYRQAASESWDCIRTTGVCKIMSDVYVGEFIFFTSLSISFTASFTDALIKWHFFGQKIADLLRGFIGSIVLGFVMPKLYFMLIDAGATATLVSFAYKPRALERWAPSLFKRIMELYPDLHKGLKTEAEQPEELK